MYLYGPGRILPKKTHLLRKGPIYIEVGAPITQASLKSLGDARAQASYLRKHYQMKYEQIANQIEQNV